MTRNQWIKILVCPAIVRRSGSRHPTRASEWDCWRVVANTGNARQRGDFGGSDDSWTVFSKGGFGVG